MKILSSAAVASLLLVASSMLGAEAPSTLNNDDSCDVIVAPAATLLLPYFEVDLTHRHGETTLFTVTNVTQVPRIARVTLWTDWSFPVFSFNVFLTGYDVQAINLYDLVARGRVAEPGTSSESYEGDRSLENDANPLLDVRGCNTLPTLIPPAILGDFQSALVTGHSSGCGVDLVGGQHVNAIGYVTIDVVRSCGNELPGETPYLTTEILYDNVLTGDYQQVNSEQNFAQGGPLVHIRAIPEGGAPGALTTNLPRTFYSHYQNGGTADRRQPLPSTFAARWISGGSTQFVTSFKIWREGLPRPASVCAMAPNGALRIADIVRFDEDENPVAFADCEGCLPFGPPVLPPTSRTDESNSMIFPPVPDESVAGWMYMNFDRLESDRATSFVANQSWVVVSMAAAGRYSADFDAASLDNGCSSPTRVTDVGGGDPAIGPASNTNNPRFLSGSPRTINNDDSCDVKVTPAATLLLPYFEVDLFNREGETTLFTVTNVSDDPQIARVTIWTDWAFPVLTFNLFLTGYDVQAINLFDVVALGHIAEPGTSSDGAAGRRSEDNDANPLLDLSSCGTLLSFVPESVLRELQTALTAGSTPTCGTKRVGSTHRNAIGYATIDLVQNCGTGFPTDASYFRSDLLFDNVLIGDYQQVASRQNFAQANPMVHIRAIPEGGRAGSAVTGFRRTFYSRLQDGGTVDRRQPLPSTFGARWISGGSTVFETWFKIWREGGTGPNAGCAVSSNGLIEHELDIVRFDEYENPTTFNPDEIITVPGYSIDLPLIMRLKTTADFLPPNPDGAVAGWMYLNLDDYRVRRSSGANASQNWVIVSMAADGRYSVDFDATAFGNGCSPPALETEEDGDAPAIGPAPNTNPRL